MQAMAHPLLSLVDRVYIINLAHRDDRRREIEKEFARLGLLVDGDRIRYWPASRPSNPGGFPSIGARGCYESHLAVLRDASSQSIDSVLILEDDCDFASVDAFAQIIEHLQQASSNWDIFYGGHDGLSGLRTDCTQARITPVPHSFGIVTAHFIIYRTQAVASLVPYLEAILRRRPGDPSGGPMHVDGAFSRFRNDHPGILTLAATPPIAIQRPSDSDIAGSSHPSKSIAHRWAISIYRKLRRTYLRWSNR
jgi:glycosyl transferase, family 25